MKRAVRFSGIFLSIFLLTAALMSVTALAANEIDVSTASSGYFTVQSTSGTARMKVGVTSGKSTVYYDYTPGGAASYTFTQGDGSYTVTLFQNISGTKYRKVTSRQVDVRMDSELAPYLASTAEITFSAADTVGQKAAELCGDAKSAGEKVVAIHNYIAANFTYDYDFAAQVRSGAVKVYTPDTAAVLAKQKGICYDMAALFAAMCRSQGVPCAVVRGTLDGQSHAWNMVWVDGSWHAMDLTRSASWRTQASTLSGCVVDLAQNGYVGGAL